jgi:hypothetical protein
MTRLCRAGILTILYPMNGAIIANCHVRPDLILIYRKPDSASLELVRSGSHSELGF